MFGLAIAALCAFLQIASTALYAAAGAPASLAARLGALGARPYEAIERIAPLPFVEAALASHALDGGHIGAAAAYASRLPRGAVRSDLEARIAERRGREPEAIAGYLDAGDDEALQRMVTALLRRGDVRGAYALEGRIGARFAELGMHPDAVADSWWRSALLARQLGDDAEAARDDDRASRTAPLNTKYLFDAGALALARDDPRGADGYFTRITRIDPADADGVAGRALAALERGDRAEATRLASRALAINPHATLVRALAAVLRSRDRWPSGVPVRLAADPAHDPLAPPRSAREWP